jgi:hypothetical protein
MQQALRGPLARIGTSRSSCRRSSAAPESDRPTMGCYTIQAYLQGWRRELSSAAPPAIATDALADLVFSLILDREAELVELAPISFARCAGSCGDCAARARGGGP